MQSSNIKLCQDEFYIAKLSITEPMLNVERMINQRVKDVMDTMCINTDELLNAVNYKVGLIEFGYHFSFVETEVSYKYYPQGWRSARGPIYTYFGERDQVLSIEFRLLANTPFDVISILNNVAAKLITTPSKGTSYKESSYTTYGEFVYKDVWEYVKEVEVTYYYKKPGFDEAYIALKNMMPELTEDIFAQLLWIYPSSNGGYNDELIIGSKEIEPFVNFQLHTQRFEKVEKKVKLLYYECEINIIACDIERNMNVLTEFFSLAVQYIKR